MADELSIKTKFAVGDLVLTPQWEMDQASPGSVVSRQTIATTETALTFSGVTTPRLVIVENLDPTNYVDIGPDSGGTQVDLNRLQPGDFCVLTLKPGVTVKAKANIASVVIEKTAFET